MKYKPGETCPMNCNCAMYDKNGKKINEKNMKKGDSFPPTPKDGGYYEI